MSFSRSDVLTLDARRLSCSGGAVSVFFWLDEYTQPKIAHGEFVAFMIVVFDFNSGMAGHITPDMRHTISHTLNNEIFYSQRIREDDGIAWYISIERSTNKGWVKRLFFETTVSKKTTKQP